MPSTWLPVAEVEAAVSYHFSMHLMAFKICLVHERNIAMLARQLGREHVEVLTEMWQQVTAVILKAFVTEYAE